MEKTYLRYQLNDGYIHNWLVAGPFELLRSAKSTDPSTIDDSLSEPEEKYPKFRKKPVELEQVFSENMLYWKWNECRDDHWVDSTNILQKRSNVCSYAYTILFSSTKVTKKICVSTNISVSVWINRELMLSMENIDGKIVTHEVTCELTKGSNEITIRMDSHTMQQSNALVAVRVCEDKPDEIEVLIPNNEIEPGFNQIRQTLERVSYQSFLPKYVFGSLAGDKMDKNEPIPVLFSHRLQEKGSLGIRLQDLDDNIFQEGEKDVSGGRTISGAVNFPLREGNLQVVIQPNANDYFIRKMMFSRHHRFFMVRNSYSSQAYGTYADRKEELLKKAPEKKTRDIFTEIAKMEAGKWIYIDKKRCHDCLKVISLRQDDALMNLVGFLGMIYRYGEDPSFPPDLKDQINDAYTTFQYKFGVSGDDPLERTEPNEVLLATAEILAGQIDPSVTFKDGISGDNHIQQGIELVNSWCIQRGKFGFEDWNCSQSFSEMLTALVHLVDFCQNKLIVELATALLDKILFILATNTYRGCFGTPQRKTTLGNIVSSRLEPTSGVCRLLWGMGVYNYEMAAPLSLALSSYEIPEIIHNIAVDSSASIWIQQSHRSRENGMNQQNIVNLALYKTRDYMLSSCQDYRPGEMGKQEHIWQAILDPDAIVFTNHTECTSDDDNHFPSLWRGNKSLPRVCQWGDFLVSIYNLPEDDWLGYTHAYFPSGAFDEYTINDKWAFAKKGNAYIGLFASSGLTWIKEGYAALRELRSYGKQTIWVCQMGHSLLDDSFADFQKKVKALEFTIDGNHFTGKNLRGDELSFGWQGSLLVNGQEQAITGYPHHQSVFSQTNYPANRMLIVHGEEGIQLNFEG